MRMMPPSADHGGHFEAAAGSWCRTRPVRCSSASWGRSPRTRRPRTSGCHLAQPGMMNSKALGLVGCAEQGGAGGANTAMGRKFWTGRASPLPPVRRGQQVFPAARKSVEFDETKAECGIGRRNAAQVMPLHLEVGSSGSGGVGRARMLCGSSTPCLREGRSYRRTAARDVLSRALKPAAQLIKPSRKPEQAQFRMDCSGPLQPAHQNEGSSTCRPALSRSPHPAFGKFERFAGRPGLAMPFSCLKGAGITGIKTGTIECVATALGAVLVTKTVGQ